MKHILFFALKGDLLPLLELVEGKGRLKYARMGNFARREVQDGVNVFEAGAGIPNLGRASADSSMACEAFLICEQGTPINPRYFQGIDGERVCIDQLANPDSIEFTPGGIWKDEVLLHGRIATASASQASQVLMKRFHVRVKKTFTKVRAFYVGPNALKLLESGKRLAGAVQSPGEYDLVPE
jgi:hypothetical protein